MSPRQALSVLDQAGATFKGERVDHYNIQQAVMILSQFIDTHDPLDQGSNGASTPANENQEKKEQKTPEEIAAEVRAKGEK